MNNLKKIAVLLFAALPLAAAANTVGPEKASLERIPENEPVSFVNLLEAGSGARLSDDDDEEEEWRLLSKEEKIAINTYLPLSPVCFEGACLLGFIAGEPWLMVMGLAIPLAINIEWNMYKQGILRKAREKRQNREEQRSATACKEAYSIK